MGGLCINEISFLQLISLYLGVTGVCQMMLSFVDFVVKFFILSNLFDFFTGVRALLGR